MSGDDASKNAELARSEARETLNQQIRTLNDIDRKANKIFRLNLIIMGVAVSAFSFFIQNGMLRENGTVLNHYSILGMLLLFGSTAAAALTYTTSDFIAGVSRNDIQEFVDGGYKYEQVSEGLALSYSKWIEFNDSTNIINALRITITVVLAIWAVTFLLLGVVDAIEAPISNVQSFLILFGLIIYTLLSGLPQQIIRWKRVTTPWSRFVGTLKSAKDYMS